MKKITCEFPRNIDYLHIATSLAREVCETITNKKIDMNFIELAVSEACTNAIQHATGIKSTTVIVSFCIHNNKLVINVSDCGKGFDIHSIQSPDIRDFPGSGLGIYILNKIMDRLEYINGVDCNFDCNFLVMTKFFDR